VSSSLREIVAVTVVPGLVTTFILGWFAGVLSPESIN
jgi:hypothetical protein